MCGQQDQEEELSGTGQRHLSFRSTDGAKHTVCVAGSGLHTGDRVLAMNGTIGASALMELMV